MKLIRYCPSRKDEGKKAYYVFAPEGAVLFTHDPYNKLQVNGSRYNLEIKGLVLLHKWLKTLPWVRLESIPAFGDTYQKAFPEGNNYNAPGTGVTWTEALVEDVDWQAILESARKADTVDADEAARLVDEEATQARLHANNVELTTTAARTAAEHIALLLPQTAKASSVTLVSVEQGKFTDVRGNEFDVVSGEYVLVVLADNAPMLTVKADTEDAVLALHRDVLPEHHTFYLERLERLPWQACTDPLVLALAQVGAIGSTIKQVVVLRQWLDELPSLAENDYKVEKNRLEAIPSPQRSHFARNLAVAAVLVGIFLAASGNLVPLAQLAEFKAQQGVALLHDTVDPFFNRANATINEPR